jgi:KUP system potassium uptake protein
MTSTGGTSHSGGAIARRTAPAQKALPTVVIAALGVVFGDIGTSPLYALRQVFHDNPPLASDHAAVTGILSLIVWAVVLSVCVKYTMLVMRADNDGEGGTLAMLGLIQRQSTRGRWAPPGALVLLVLFGSALLYGDGVITPSISVLSAVEGLNVATSALKPLVLPISVGVLVALFLGQKRGTDAVGRIFGPVMMVWFVAIGALGALSLWRAPGILYCLDPSTGWHFLVTHGMKGYLTLGAVVLAFSGVEALFADLGHFGRRPIVLAWYFIVLPGLLLNYLGQGALVLRHAPSGAEPFYGLVPQWALYFMVALSTAATVIASQALISGAFSLTRQAVNMGLAPPYRICHTSQQISGQVYMPLINTLLMVGCVAIVLSFRSSDSLGNAYGLAVIGTMTVTSIVFLIVMRRVWHWSLALALPIFLGFMVFDLAFLGANLAKILQGAWVPLAIGLSVFLLLWDWTALRARFGKALAEWAMPVEQFCAEAATWDDRREGTVVFLAYDLAYVPLVGRHRWLRENCRYKRVLLLRFENPDTAYVYDEQRVTVEDRGGGLFTAVARYGFMESPHVGDVLPNAMEFDWNATVFVLPQPITLRHQSWFIAAASTVFNFLRRTGLSPIERFHIPPNQSISVGLELDI